MVEHKLDKNKLTKEPVITWRLQLDEGKLRLVGKQREFEQTVITIYRTGRLYCHYSIGLTGLDVNSFGQIMQYTTPAEAHNHSKAKE